MRYLLDSSAWMRAALNADTLPATVRSFLDDPDEILGLSVISLWEAAKKHQRGRLPMPMELTAWLKAAVPHHVKVLPLTNDIIVDAARLPDFPVNDPADEIILATARIHRLTLLTSDTKLKGYRHARIRHFTPVLENGRK